MPVARGEHALAWASAEGVELVGTRDALYLAQTGAEPIRIPWEQIEAADWDADTGQLQVAEVGRWSEPRPVHMVTLDDPRRLLQLIRERVTASVVFQRHVPIFGRRGVRVIARRAPRGDQPVRWIYEYDEGIDPEDAEVRRLATAALAAAQDDVGLG